MAPGAAYERAALEYADRPGARASQAAGETLEEAVHETEMRKLTLREQEIVTEAKRLMEEYGFSQDDALRRASKNVRSR